MPCWRGTFLLLATLAWRYVHGRQCLRAGWAFQQPPPVASQLPQKDTAPEATTLADADSCQAKCAATSSCSVFTFDITTEKCLLQGNDATPLLLPTAISGPKRCPEMALPEALQRTRVAARNAGATAENHGLEASIAVSKAAMATGEEFGLSNVQKAQMASIAVGRLAATKAALKGLSETDQLQAAAKAAAANAAQKDRQGMYAAGGIAAESPAAKNDPVQSRATYAMRMALDVVARNGLHVKVTEEQLQVAAEVSALMLAIDGGSTEEVYSTTAAAMQRVAQDYHQSTESQADWSAIAQAAALDWYEESWTNDVTDLRISMPDVWARAWDAAQVSKQGGASLQSQLLAAGQAARANVAAEDFDLLQQARQSSIAIAETARRLQAPSTLAGQVAAEGASELGLSLAMARYEAHRARRLVEATAEAHHWDRTSLQLKEPRFSDVDLEEIWKAAMQAAQSREETGSLTEQLSAAASAAVAWCAHMGYDAAGQARMAALAVGEVARRLEGDQQLRISAAGFAAAKEAQDLGVTPTQAAAESNLARTVAESNEEEVRSAVRRATANFTVASLNVKDAEMAGVEADAAAVLGQDVKSMEQRSMMIGGGIGMAVLFVTITIGTSMFLAAGRRNRPRRRPVVDLHAADENEEGAPLISTEEEKGDTTQEHPTSKTGSTPPLVHPPAAGHGFGATHLQDLSRSPFPPHGLHLHQGIQPGYPGHWPHGHRW